MTRRPPPSGGCPEWLRQAWKSGSLDVDADRLADALLRREPALLVPPERDETLGRGPLWLLGGGDRVDAPD